MNATIPRKLKVANSSRDGRWQPEEKGDKMEGGSNLLVMRLTKEKKKAEWSPGRCSGGRDEEGRKKRGKNGPFQ